MQPVWAIGLMSGTALDGDIDIALLHSDGQTVSRCGPWGVYPYPKDVRALVEEAVSAARGWNFSGPEPEVFARAEDALTRAQADIVERFMKQENFSTADVALIGFHGQTVLHRPPTPSHCGATCQLGDGALMARILGIDVAFDFRSADVRAGGQGAPLSAIYHKALLKRSGLDARSAVLNMGGVGNITWVGPDGLLIAFDTGPANGPVNDWVDAHHMGRMDVDGTLARAGRVDEARLEALLSNPYFCAPYPKSLDRFAFTMDMAKGLSVEDGAALLTAFAAAAVGKALDLLPERPEQLIICGGGRLNPVLMDELATRADVEIKTAESVGWNGDAIEAQCFAFLALRVSRGLPVSFPTTTAVPWPIVGGEVAGAGFYM